MLDLGNLICQLIHEKTDALVQIELTKGYHGDSLRRLPHLEDTELSLGWCAMTSLEQGLRQTLDSML